MTEKLQQTIKEEISKLPKETQEAINIFDWVAITEQIGKKYLLTESELNDFQVETLLVLIGIQPADLYAQNIENEVGISKNEAEKISAEVFDKIFEPIGNFMQENIKKNLHTKNVTSEQNVDFILSGGDYSVFMNTGPGYNEFSQKTPARNASQGDAGGDKISGYTTNTPPKMMDLKNKFLYDNEKNT